MVDILNRYRSLKTVSILIMVLIPLSCGLAGSNHDVQNNPIPAFPGALGGGKFTTGGRGGKVIKVTNLNDSGEGSLREAIEADGVRTIIFEVSGTIDIESPLLITNGNLTIAGQTAPGDGICIRGNETRLEADNIIIRFMRFRPGDISESEYDALTGFGLRDIIIDHCSMSWSTDETVSFYDNKNFTLQWSIISESLNDSFHQKGQHGYGGIWGGNNASFLFNLIAHHKSRNPRLQGARYNPADGAEIAEVVNNIIFNWRDKSIYGGEEGKYNIAGNIFIPGPATVNTARREILEPYEPWGKFYLEDNIFLNDAGFSEEAGWENVSFPSGNMIEIMVTKPFIMKGNTVVNDAMKAFDLILEFSGASLSRDHVDKRIVSEVKQQTYTFGEKGIIDSQNDTEGWPLLISLTAPVDSDGDGIPDLWEIENGLDHENPADGNLNTLNPYYTNLEVYFNNIVEKKCLSNRPFSEQENNLRILTNKNYPNGTNSN